MLKPTKALKSLIKQKHKHIEPQQQHHYPPSRRVSNQAFTDNTTADDPSPAFRHSPARNTQVTTIGL